MKLLAALQNNKGEKGAIFRWQQAVTLNDSSVLRWAVETWMFWPDWAAQESNRILWREGPAGKRSACDISSHSLLLQTNKVNQITPGRRTDILF